MNNQRKHGNLLIIILIIVLVDALFIGYSMLNKGTQKNSERAAVTTQIIMVPANHPQSFMN